MSLYSWNSEFLAKCRNEGDRDPRHLGRYLTYAYECPRCGRKEITLTPDYPYCGPNSTWTCSACACVMTLSSTVPVRGKPKSITLESVNRICA